MTRKPCPFIKTSNLSYLFQHLLLELPLDFLSLLIGVRLTVEVKKCAEIELRCL